MGAIKLKIASKKKAITINQTAFTHYFKDYLEILPIISLTNPFGRNNPKKIYILTTDQSADTNCTSMEHLQLLATTIVPKELVIGIAQLGDKLIAEANKSIASIDIQVQGDQEFPFVSWESGNKMSVDFGWNIDDKIGMNPLRTIRIPRPQVNRTSISNCDIFNLVRRVFLWHRTMKNENEKPGGKLQRQQYFQKF